MSHELIECARPLHIVLLFSQDLKLLPSFAVRQRLVSLKLFSPVYISIFPENVRKPKVQKWNTGLKLVKINN